MMGKQKKSIEDDRCTLNYRGGKLSDLFSISLMMFWRDKQCHSSPLKDNPTDSVPQSSYRSKKKKTKPVLRDPYQSISLD